MPSDRTDNKFYPKNQLTKTTARDRPKHTTRDESKQQSNLPTSGHFPKIFVIACDYNGTTRKRDARYPQILRSNSNFLPL
jgi:hypothetical protein